MEKQLMEECLDYFTNRSVYKKLFFQMREKYASLGYMGGRITLTDLTSEEKVQLGGFVQKDYTGKQSVSVSAALLQKALEASRFSRLTWEEILEAYFKTPLSVKKEEEQARIQEKQDYFSKILNNCRDENGKIWLSRVLEKQEPGCQLLQKQYGQDKNALKEILNYILSAIEKLPVYHGKTCRLAVFAADITGNPHWFDDGTAGGKLLLYYLESHFPPGEPGESRPEKRNRLFYQAGILNDDLSNHVLTYGLRGQKKGGREHQGLKGYFDMREPVFLTLLTLQELENIWGNPIIYVVENPSIFSLLIEQHPDISAICTNGQLRLSTLLLMDQLKKESSFYYGGDFDPEGLLIAQTLKERCGQQLHLWNYQEKYYEMAKSDVILSEERLKKLDKIHQEELQEIKKKLQQEKKAGYQENIQWDKITFPALSDAL